jgi:methyltransferase (TIGR00027 family)
MSMSPVGTTAQWIAAARAIETESAKPLFTDPFARELAGDAGFGLLTLTRQWTGAGSFSGPDPYLSVRTRFLDDAVLRAVREQALQQVVILAAGMDTRAFRLEWPDGVVVFEVDRDDVFDYKEPVLARLGATARCQRRVLRADLTGDWMPALEQAGFDPRRPAAFLVEGLVMYLHPPAAEGVLGAVSRLAADGSWIGLDMVNREMLESPYSSGYLKKLEELGSGWHFGESDPEAWLGRFGWQATVVLPGDPEARYDRWPYPTIPRSVPGMPRTMFVTGTRGASVRHLQPGPVSAALAERYTWGDGCEGWHLVRRDGLSVIQERMPAGTSEVRHRHDESTQFFYVLTGEIEVEVDGVTHVVGACSGIEVRRRVPHQVFNRAAAPAEFLVVSQPPAQGDRWLVPKE